MASLYAFSGEVNKLYFRALLTLLAFISSKQTYTVHSSNEGFQIPAIFTSSQENIDRSNLVKIQGDDKQHKSCRYLILGQLPVIIEVHFLEGLV